MIQLGNRTQFSFRRCFGSLEAVLSAQNAPYAAITDRGSTWGHFKWGKACEAAGIAPIYGVELHVCLDQNERSKQPRDYIKLLAKNTTGLTQIYKLVTLATENFYYEPRIDFQQLSEELSSGDIIAISGDLICEEHLMQLGGCIDFLVGISPSTPERIYRHGKKHNCNFIAMSNTHMPFAEDMPAYEIVAGIYANKMTCPQHIISEEHEWRGAVSFMSNADKNSAINTLPIIAGQCKAKLEKGEMVVPTRPDTLYNMCIKGAKERKLPMTDEYMSRLHRELDLIKEKDFEDYFYLVADLCIYAKKHMLVGPARGSSSGSLVCYLLYITEVDPVPYGLLFERFIDINRFDYPDIDIDFPDKKRQMVFDYLENTYGSERVARLGTVGKYKAKSTIGDVGKALNVPAWELTDFKDSIIERSSGDARAGFCVMDTFTEFEAGRALLDKYPEMEVAALIEGHATYHGQHAAGMLVTREPVSKYVPVDMQTGAAMIDKNDAEELNLLKIDALGLRTLSVIEDTLDHVGWSYDDINGYETDDKAAFEILNAGKFAGIFQFEGYALQSLTRQMKIEYIEDIISITALARPGPLNSGGATEFLKRRVGESPVVYMPMAEDITKITYGVVVYQEQVMKIAREIGLLSWEDTSQLRKAMSKSKGKEFFDRYWLKFREGAMSQGISEDDAQILWDNINTMGSWAFNRSHAVAYGLMSYWCCVLKAHFPLEFAVACLSNAKDNDQSVKILRELDGEGIYYKPYDRNLSEENWSVHNGLLIGGVIGIKGIGPKSAPVVARKIAEGKKLTPRQEVLLSEGTTPYDMVFEGRERWSHIYEHPKNYNIISKLTYLDDIHQKSNGQYVIIAKVVEKNLRDHNELQNMERRGGELMTGQTLFLNLTIEDDTGPIIGTINRYDYLRLGLPLVDGGKLGDWYIFKARNYAGFRKLHIKRVIKLTGDPRFMPEPYEEVKEI